MSPILVSDLSTEEYDELIADGWRTFFIGSDQFIVEARHRRMPTLGGKVVIDTNKMPFATYSYESKGPNKGKKFDLIAYPYDTMTIQDIDDMDDIPISLSKLKNVKGYMWSDTGLHIHQKGKQKLLDVSDQYYEYMSREMRGWYGVRIQRKDSTGIRTLITTDAKMAEDFLLAGGKARVVKNLNNSYIASRAAYMRTGRTK